MELIPETPLDPLLARLYHARGLCLELRPDTPAEIITPSGRLLDDAISGERLAEILTAVTPLERKEELQGHGHTTFDLDTREGLFRVSLRTSPAGVCASVYDPRHGHAWPSGAPMPASRFPAMVVFLACAGVIVLGITVLWMSLSQYHPSLGSHAGQQVKLLTLSVMQYAQDYDGALPGWVRNPDGRYAHNTWDEQIRDFTKTAEVFRTPRQTGIKSPSDPHKQRVLTYAMNGALIAPYDGATGEVDWRVPAGRSPRALGTRDIAEPAETILLAQIATDDPPPTTPAGAAGP